ncbi:MAG: hypothetical protein IPI28_14920 [Candidatus Omnitrophica bacterium]|nr:hypothetical protein [Candidatus Omnitrophota bacterium]
MIRGGSWNNNSNNCRSAARNNNNPNNRNNNIGLRLVLVPEAFLATPVCGGHGRLSKDCRRPGGKTIRPCSWPGDDGYHGAPWLPGKYQTCPPGAGRQRTSPVGAPQRIGMLLSLDPNEWWDPLCQIRTGTEVL